MNKMESKLDLNKLDIIPVDSSSDGLPNKVLQQQHSQTKLHERKKEIELSSSSSEKRVSVTKKVKRNDDAPVERRQKEGFSRTRKVVKKQEQLSDDE